MKTEYIYIKLGGSIITDKNRPFALRKNTLKRLAKEIKKSHAFLNKKYKNKYKIIIGHGSGSFGHYVAKRHNLKEGKNKIKGESLIEDEMAVLKLNRIVLEYLEKENIMALPVSPLSFMNYNSRKKNFEFYSKPFLNILQNNIIPIVYGDNILDEMGNFYLCSTETIFLELIKFFKPSRMIFVTDTPVYYFNKETGKKIFIKTVTKKNIREIKKYISSNKFNVTGGLSKKLLTLLNLSKKYHSDIKLINGMIKNNLIKEIKRGNGIGTIVNNTYINT